MFRQDDGITYKEDYRSRQIERMATEAATTKSESVTVRGISDEGGQIECPCQNFAAMSKIVDALDSEDRMKALLDWIGGSTDKKALESNNVQRLSCGKRLRCRFRFGTSFAILNCIREACRPFLEQQQKQQQQQGGTQFTELHIGTDTLPCVSYEEAFPSLSNQKPASDLSVADLSTHPAVSNILVPPNKSNHRAPIDNSKFFVSHPAAANILVPREKTTNQKPVSCPPNDKKKNKRRIRPQVAALSAQGTSAWNQQAAYSVSTLNGNIANLPSQEPLTLEKRNLSPTKVTVTSIVRAPFDLTKTNVNLATPTKEKSIIEDSRSPLPLTKTGVVIEPSKDEHLMRMVEIYLSLLLNHLVPSTALELHLLLRLLTVECEDMKPPRLRPTNDDGSPVFFAPIFSSAQRCRTFAALTLSRLGHILRNLGFPLIKSLLRCEPFTKALPNIAGELESILGEYSSQGLRMDYPTDEVTGTHAMFNLPFDYDRDSRNNYRTQDEAAIYKNREESRDAFLYQLRAFINVRGRVLRAQEVDRSLEKIRKDAKMIVDRLLNINMAWFAQFFCDLLLQVGLAPIEETDQELLNIADKEKLQVCRRLILIFNLNPRDSHNCNSFPFLLF